ncbi:MAG: Hsp20/alpha crystallin family protein [Chloroflexi bacterium]|nr:Hsp20/alpha crystallin family protein [Chloroflexota bacterium]
MVMQRWDPFNELRQMQDTMNRLWRGYGVRDGEDVMESWAVPLDVVQEGDNILVRASMPGIKPEDINVTLENDVLTIKGETRSETEKTEGNYLLRERRSGAFHRSLRLPDTVDTEKADTKYENGVLTVTFPKIEAKKAKRLEVKAG